MAAAQWAQLQRIFLVLVLLAQAVGPCAGGVDDDFGCYFVLRAVQSVAQLDACYLRPLLEQAFCFQIIGGAATRCHGFLQHPHDQARVVGFGVVIAQAAFQVVAPDIGCQHQEFIAREIMALPQTCHAVVNRQP